MSRVYKVKNFRTIQISWNSKLVIKKTMAQSSMVKL